MDAIGPSGLETGAEADMDARNRRAFLPTVERIEPKALLSALTTGLLSSRPDPSLLVSAALRAQEGPIFNTTGPYPNATPGGAAAPLLGAGTPTARELARETFKAGFGGPFFGGPGRFTDQAHIEYFQGIGGSNMFLHGDFNMAVVTPTDPSKPLFGEAVLNDKNTNSSGEIGLILTGNRSDVDSHGRPTKLTFKTDPNIYSGIYFVDQSKGTVTIHYNDAGGFATAKFSGFAYTSGLANPLVNSALYSRSGRLHKRGGP
jgi:hypothetical protein